MRFTHQLCITVLLCHVIAKANFMRTRRHLHLAHVHFRLVQTKGMHTISERCIYCVITTLKLSRLPEATPTDALNQALDAAGEPTTLYLLRLIVFKPLLM